MTPLSLRAVTGLALLAAFISGTNNFLTKIAVTALNDPVAFTTLKNIIVAVFLLSLAILFRRWEEVRTLSFRQASLLVMIGLIGGAAAFALYFTGLAGTSAINASLIHKTLFLWVAALALPFLGERMTRLQWIGIGVIFVGNLFVGGFSAFKGNMAELFVLVATILWAVENIIVKKALAALSSVTVAAARMALGSLFLLAYIFIFGHGLSLGAVSAEAWGWTILTSILLLGYVLSWYTALKYAPATYVATLLVPATIMTNILSAVFVTGTLTGVQLGSMAAVFLGAALVILATRDYASAVLSDLRTLRSRFLS